MNKVVRFCPRCESPLNSIEKRELNGQTYFYAIHIYRDEFGRRRIKKCYLGAENYRYVKRLHEDSSIEFSGLLNNQRYIEYLEHILEHLTNVNMDQDTKRIVENRLRQALKTLNPPKPRKPRVVKDSEPIEPFIKELYRSREWKISIVALNSLYVKHMKYAIELGLSLDQYNDMFSALDNSLTYSELEQILSQQLSGEYYVKEFARGV